MPFGPLFLLPCKYISIFRDGNPAPNLPEAHVLLPGRHVGKEMIFFFTPPPWVSPFLLISLPQHLVFEIWIRFFLLSGPTHDFSAVASFAFKAVEEECTHFGLCASVVKTMRGEASLIFFF